MDAVEIQPERALVKRLRESACLSQTELDRIANVRRFTCARFECTRAAEPLSQHERATLVKFLTVLIARRRDYHGAMFAWRNERALSIRDAASRAGIPRAVWWRMERGGYTRFPFPLVRQRVDALLDGLTPGRDVDTEADRARRAELWSIVERNRANAAA